VAIRFYLMPAIGPSELHVICICLAGILPQIPELFPSLVEHRNISDVAHADGLRPSGNASSYLTADWLPGVRNREERATKKASWQYAVSWIILYNIICLRHRADISGKQLLGGQF